MSAQRASARSAMIVTSRPGQTSAGELARQAAVGERPRKDYVELARRLDADVIDSAYISEQGGRLPRLLAVRAGVDWAQIAEAFLHRNDYRHICVWSDRIGLSLALLYKLSRSRRDLALVSAWVSEGSKAVLLRRFGVHSHLGAMIHDSTLQMRLASDELGVPSAKLFDAPQPVDDLFWRPEDLPAQNRICSVGWEARDYGTLLRAVAPLDVDVDLVAGSIVWSALGGSGKPGGSSGATLDGLPPRVRLCQNLSWHELRALYAQARFVVLPLQDVEYNAGITAMVEAMAMGKAVIVTRTRGLDGVIEDGVHGIYVQPGDPAALRDAIEFLLSNPDEALRMGRAGRDLVEERHSMDLCIGRLASIVRATAEEQSESQGDRQAAHLQRARG